MIFPGETTSFQFVAIDAAGLTTTGTVTVQATGRVDAYFGNGGIAVVSTTEAKKQYPFGLFKPVLDQGTGVNFDARKDIAAKQIIGGPKMCVLTSGNLVYTWSSTGTDGDRLGVNMRMYDTVGNAVSATQVVNTFTAKDQSNQDVAPLADGGFVVVWCSDLQDGSGGGIFAQRFNEFGFKNGEEFQVNSESYSAQMSPRVASFDSGGFVVVWQSYGQDGDVWGIFGRTFSGRTGRGISPEFQINTHTEGFQNYPEVETMPGTEYFMVAWESYLQEGLGVQGGYVL